MSLCSPVCYQLFIEVKQHSEEGGLFAVFQLLVRDTSNRNLFIALAEISSEIQAVDWVDLLNTVL